MIRSGRMADSAEQSDEPLETDAWQWPGGDVCFSQPLGLACLMAGQPGDADSSWGSIHDGG